MAAKVIQVSNPQHVENALQAYQEDHDNEDDKLFLLMRVVFELPETRPLGDRMGAWIPAFGGWLDTSGSDNRSTNAACGRFYNLFGTSLQRCC